MRRFKHRGMSLDVLLRKLTSREGRCLVNPENRGCLSTSIKRFFGYTLAEIIVVMLIIAVIVAVTIGVTKHKLDNIVTYTYYSAYSTLRTATAQILADYDPTDERYQAKAEEPTLLAKVQTFFASNFGVLAAHAANTEYDLMPGGGIIDAGAGGYGPNDVDIGGMGRPGCCSNGGANLNAPTDAYPNCQSANGTASNTAFCLPLCCYPSSQPSTVCPVGATRSCNSSGYCTCICPDTWTYNAVTNKCVKDGIGAGGSGGCVCCPNGGTPSASPVCPGGQSYKANNCTSYGGVRSCLAYCCTKAPVTMTQCPSGTTDGGSVLANCTDGDSNAFYIDAPEFTANPFGPVGQKLCCCPDGQEWDGETCKTPEPEPKECTGPKPETGCKVECNTNTGEWFVIRPYGTLDLFLSGATFNEATCKYECPAGKSMQGGKCVENEPVTPDCIGGKIWNGSSCVCPEGQIDQGGTCVDDPSDDCTGGQVWNGSSCECPSGQIWDGSECKPDIDCSGEAPCGKQCDRTTGGWVDIPGFSRECNAEQNQIWSEAQCRCIPSSRTISTNGQKYCEYLVDLFNTRSNSNTCSGTAIGANETNFSGKTPDITLRNGMRMYNVRQPYALLPDLANNIEGGKIEQEDGSIIDTNAYGYTVYIDIDGEKGGSEKWVDVYPFYVTLSGMVIPGYDKDHPGEYGGDSRNHMQVSIEDEVIEDGRRKIKWLAKSVSYKEAACGAGYIGANTPYCREGHASVYNNECSNDNSLCRLKYIKPVKFLF